MQVDAAETADGRLVVLHTRQLAQLMAPPTPQQPHVRSDNVTDHAD
jgi:hypothetical protein